MASLASVLKALPVYGQPADAAPIAKAAKPAKPPKSTAAGRRHMARVRKAGCVLCNRFEPTGLPVEVHHVAEESGLRSEFSVAGLCGSPKDGGHHRGSAGLHGMGSKAFLRQYRPPGESEYGLLVWANEDMARTK